jgi:signal transduction histidine kinase
VELLQAVSPMFVEMVMREIGRMRENAELPEFGEFEANNYIMQWLNMPVVAEGNRIGHLLILRNVTDERRLARMREDLVHTIVHDLRNPLSAVNICVDLMMEQLAGYQLSREIYDYVEIVQRNTEKTTRLVDMILDINRLESGQMPITFRSVGLSGLVDEVLNLQRPLAEEEQIRLEKEVPLSLPNVLIDVSLIERVLQNLLDNALKTTPAGRGVIRVEARSASTDGGRRVLVSVVDNGPGIPADIRDHMFQKFTTSEGQRRRGTGLGLAFCRMALDAHEEGIWVAQSAPGVGTTITFSLPIALE